MDISLKDITIDDLNLKVAKVAELRALEAEVAKEKKAVTEQLETAENEILEILMAKEMTTYASPLGKVGISYRSSVRTPKTPEAREAFFNYLRSKGIFDNMISVNSATLNSFYKEELELAKEQGNVDFSIPGLEEVTLQAILSFRKA